MEQLKRGRGRPKGSVKMTIQRFADNPPMVLPKTDHQRLKELKELMIRSGGKDVAQWSALGGHLCPHRLGVHHGVRRAPLH